jgi:DivIVA domain-containing protein
MKRELYVATMNRTARAPDLARIATVGVVGAGFMGAQLALHIATRGYPVAVVDQSMDALGRMRGYDTAEVDAFRQEIRDTFLGTSQRPVRADDVRGKLFRMARRGYDVVQVDAFCDEAEERLAAMRPTSRGRRD